MPYWRSARGGDSIGAAGKLVIAEGVPPGWETGVRAAGRGPRKPAMMGINAVNGRGDRSGLSRGWSSAARAYRDD